jgi:hypothetical protein
MYPFRQILSFSLRFTADSALALRGHENSFQFALHAAAQRKGLPFRILAPVAADGVHGDVLPILGSRSPEAGVVALASLLESEPPSLILHYEATTAWLEAFIPLAGRFPQHRFLVNLFRHEPGLSVPHLSGSSGPLRTALRFTVPTEEKLRALRQRLPQNLGVTAETERRALLAQSVGLGNVQSWPNYTPLADDERGAPLTRPYQNDRSLRVMIPLSARQVDRHLLRHIAQVIRLVEGNRANSPRYHWSVEGALESNPQKLARVERLRWFGINEIVSHAVPADQYLRAYVAHDVVWFPIQGHYGVASSGKVMEALLAGRPLLAPAGSFAAAELRRWVPAAPAYEGAREAAEILLMMPLLQPIIAARLDEARTNIRERYSATRALNEILRIGSELSEPTMSHASSLPSTDPQATQNPALSAADRPVSRFVLIRSILRSRVGIAIWPLRRRADEWRHSVQETVIRVISAVSFR